MLLRALAAAVFLSCINAVTLAQSNKVDVTGVWIFTVESPAGKSNPTITFKQDGEKLTGQYSSQLMGQADLTGTVKGQAIEFLVSATVQGTHRLSEEEITAVAERVVAGRMENPGG